METLQGNDLKVAYWINTHRAGMKRLVRMAGIIFIVIIWLVFIFNVIIYVKNYSVSKNAQISMVEQSGNFNNISRPRGINILDSAILDAGEGSVDAFSLVSNPNNLFAASFDYSFTVAGKTTEFNSGFIMPGEEKYLVLKNIESNVLTGDPGFKISNIEWEKLQGLPPEVVFDVADLEFGTIDVLNVDTTEIESDLTGVSDVLDSETNINSTEKDSAVPSDEAEPAYATPDDVDNSDMTSSEPTFTSDRSAVSATINNYSPIGFRSTVIVAIIRSESGDIIAVHQQVIHDFNSFAQQPISMSWARKFVFNAVPEIHVYVDYLNAENIILLGDS